MTTDRELSLWGFDAMWTAVMEQPSRATIFADWLDEHGRHEKAIVVRECVMASRGQPEFLRRLLQLFFGKVEMNELVIRITDRGNGTKETSVERPCSEQVVWRGLAGANDGFRMSFADPVIFGTLMLDGFSISTRLAVLDWNPPAPPPPAFLSTPDR